MQHVIMLVGQTGWASEPDLRDIWWDRDLREEVKLFSSEATAGRFIQDKLTGGAKTATVHGEKVVFEPKGWNDLLGEGEYLVWFAYKVELDTQETQPLSCTALSWGTV